MGHPALHRRVALAKKRVLRRDYEPLTVMPTLFEEAANPATQPQRLRALAPRGKSIRHSGVLNPNAPLSLLLWLATWH